MERCENCGFLVSECICLDCCSHDCLLDHGLQYCPICLPKGTGIKTEPEDEKDTN